MGACVGGWYVLYLSVWECLSGVCVHSCLRVWCVMCVCVCVCACVVCVVVCACVQPQVLTDLAVVPGVPCAAVAAARLRDPREARPAV